MALDEAQWQVLTLKACDDDGRVLESWDSLWDRSEVLDGTDPSGELRFRWLVLEGCKLMLAFATEAVNTAEGGGQSGDWGQYFDHIKMLHDVAETTYNEKLKAITSAAGIAIASILAHSLTPVYPGHPNPGSPRYMGDPRYDPIFRRHS